MIAAYDQLASEGFLTVVPRSAARVADLGGVEAMPAAAGPKLAAAAGAPAGRLRSARGAGMVARERVESVPGMPAFHPGTPDIARFPFAHWRRLVAHRMNPTGEDLFGYHSITGHPDLRRAISDYLRLSRSVDCHPDRIVVTNGAQAGLDLVSRLLLDPGDEALMEEPGYPGARACLLAAGAKLVPLPVSPSGWDLEAAARRQFRLAYVTPACQMPFGVTMRMEQRLRLIELAAEREAFVIEDDFDGEYRFTGQPIPSLQGQDRHGRVIYLGTFAKTLFPALRLGYLVLPEALMPGIDTAIAHTGQYPPLGLQAALADFMEAGYFARHVRGMRRLYGRRRERFIGAVGRALGEWLTLVPSDAGIQTVWTLNSRWRDTALAGAGRARKLNLTAFSTHFWNGYGLNGLILGYAALEDKDSDAAIDRLARLLGENPP